MNPTDMFIGAGSDFGDLIGILVVAFLAAGGIASSWWKKRRAKQLEEERQLRKSRYSAVPAAKPSTMTAVDKPAKQAADKSLLTMHPESYEKLGVDRGGRAGLKRGDIFIPLSSKSKAKRPSARPSTPSLAGILNEILGGTAPRARPAAPAKRAAAVEEVQPRRRTEPDFGEYAEKHVSSFDDRAAYHSAIEDRSLRRMKTTARDEPRHPVRKKETRPGKQARRRPAASGAARGAELGVAILNSGRIREAVVLAEVLGPPVGERDNYRLF